MDRLILLPEAEANRIYFDAHNSRALYRLLWLFVAWAVIEALVWIVDGEYLQVGRSVASLIFIRWLYFIRDRRFLVKHFRPVLLSFLSVQFLLLRYLDLDPAAALQPQDFALPWILVLFRLPPAQAAIPLGVLWTVSGGHSLLTPLWSDQLPAFWLLVGQAIILAIVLSWVKRSYLASQLEFLDNWRREHRRHREQQRMRDELDDARKIQLSMLPASDPKIPWLDIAGISIPASEVGGDYYGYFTVSPVRQTVVVADVAGHGVASALLLSGIRSCLYLLHESPLAPAETLTKLDRMVRQTTASRLFVTMLYVVFDHEKKELTLSVAGHPPMLHYRAATNDVVEVGSEALPLGTALGNNLEQLTRTYERGDIFLLYTDGIAETVNSRQDLYGNERLRHRLRATAHDRSAKEIRDTLLGDVWNFKADGEQTDDITIVVIKAL
ncbi:MAG: PP2C family protein-serine/threonine phosphatase [Acidobacteriota bacterium]